jgi:hypothetical protein
MILISTQQIPCKLVLNEPLVKLLMICLFPRFRPSVLILVSSICSTQALADVHDVPSRWPTASERSAISAPQYKRPPDGISECLGRLTFELPAKVEWPTATHDSYGSPFNHIFSAKVFDPGDAIEIGSIRVAVMHPADENAKQRIVRNFPANRVMELKKDLAYAQGELRRLEGKVKNSTDEINSVRLQVRDIADIEEAIKSNRVDPVDLGVSESYGYGERVVVANEEHEFSVLHAYLFRGDTIYLFESRTPILSEGDDAAHRLQFRDKVGKFRVRNPHEIPAGPGVCFPSGFLLLTLKFAAVQKPGDHPALLHADIVPVELAAGYLIHNLTAGNGQIDAGHDVALFVPDAPEVVDSHQRDLVQRRENEECRGGLLAKWWRKTSGILLASLRVIVNADEIHQCIAAFRIGNIRIKAGRALVRRSELSAFANDTRPALGIIAVIVHRQWGEFVACHQRQRSSGHRIAGRHCISAIPPYIAVERAPHGNEQAVARL